jgi:hypothetical protein
MGGSISDAGGIGPILLPMSIGFGILSQSSEQ